MATALAQRLANVWAKLTRCGIVRPKMTKSKTAKPVGIVLAMILEPRHGFAGSQHCLVTALLHLLHIHQPLLHICGYSCTVLHVYIVSRSLKHIKGRNFIVLRTPPIDIYTFSHHAFSHTILYPQMDRPRSKHNGVYGREVVGIGDVQGLTLHALKEILV